MHRSTDLIKLGYATHLHISDLFGSCTDTTVLSESVPSEMFLIANIDNLSLLGNLC